MFKLLFLNGAMALSLLGMPIQNDEQFKAAVSQIGKSDKMVLMIYTTDECPECQYMKQKVFHEKEVETYLNRYFVVIEKNVLKSNLPDGFDYFGIPTMFFIDKEGKKTGTVIGSKRPPQFLNELRHIRGK